MSSIVQQPRVRNIEEIEALEVSAPQIRAGEANASTIKNFHQNLKSFKEGTIGFSNPKKPDAPKRTIKVTWNEAEGKFLQEMTNLQAAMSQGNSKQSYSSVAVGSLAAEAMKMSAVAPEQDKVTLRRFSSTSAPAISFGSFESSTYIPPPPPPQPPSIAERLNTLEQIDREGRRADASSLEKQSENNLASQVFASAKFGNNPTLRVAHSNLIANLSRRNLQSLQTSITPINSEAMDVVSPYQAAPTLKSSGVSSSSKVGKISAITGHGYAPLRNQRILLYGFDAQRRAMKEDLIDKFEFRKLQTMNEYNACIGIGLSLKFKGYCNFFNQVASNKFKINLSKDSRFTLSEVEEWVECLKKNANQFDFSDKLGTQKERLSFFLKNGVDNKNTNAQQTGFLLSKLFREKKWDQLVTMLAPAFDLLNLAGKELHEPQITETYKKLDEYQKKILDDMVTYAFLRKTSKLGMTFAREKGIPVLFAWKVPDVSDNLEELRTLLEAKPYKYEIAAAREVAGSRISLEAITLSEMRELGRLKQKMMAPGYLLIIDINEDDENEKMISSPSPARGNLKFGGF